MLTDMAVRAKNEKSPTLWSGIINYDSMNPTGVPHMGHIAVLSGRTAQHSAHL